MSAEAHQEILRTEGLSKFFPGVKALDNVNFSLRRGEIMALLGENGAGKSTLIKALTGVYHADRGTIWLEGQAISPKNTAHAQQLGIGTVYQEVNLLPNMSVADNLFIGREPRRFGLLRRKEMEARATALMASYGFSLDVREPLNRFSVAMQQIVAICRAIDLSAKVLILDEPTASLDTQEVEMLFTLMRQLRDNGVSLIFVTHFLDQVYAVSDRITVLRNGTFVGCRETRELPQIELVKMMEIAERFIRQLGIRTPSAEQPIEFLSGGNQQKVLLSRWLLTKPQFLILDEPTRGIDVGAHAEIIRLIETLCADGLALLVISSELEELVGYADRVIILRDRRQVAEIPLAELSVPAIMNAIAA